jgi:hypothetical protein
MYQLTVVRGRACGVSGSREPLCWVCGPGVLCHVTSSKVAAASRV